jgi:hypothetical protein
MEFFDYKGYVAERMKKAENQAYKYLYGKKERKPYYWAEGNTLYDVECRNGAFFHLTDDEITRIKQLIIDTVNADQPEAEPVTTVKEALSCLHYSEIFEQCEELRTLLGERCEKANLDPEKIDFDTRYYFYDFSIVTYNYDEDKTCGPIAVDVMLSDKDYLTLLSLQIYDRKNFCFNKLLKTNPELATKLCKKVEDGMFSCSHFVHFPYTILFDEVRADAEIIDGPIDESDEIFVEDIGEETHQVTAYASNHLMSISEYFINDADDFFKDHNIYQIDADAVMTALGAKNYRDIMIKLKEKFNTPSAFSDIKAWLTASGISFEDDTDE